MPRSANTSSAGSRKRAKAPARRQAGSAAKLFAGILIGATLTILAIPAYLYFGRPPVAVSDPPALWEHLIQRTAVNRRIARESKPAPFPAGEDAFEAAARTYRSQCAGCHGTPVQDAQIGSAMVPRAPQFFNRDRRATAAKTPGELFWPTAFGIRRSGMPAYRKALTNTQLWQLALLLHSADQELPDPVRALLTPNVPPTAPTATAPLR